MKESKFKLKHYNFPVQLIMVIALALILGIFGIYFNIHDGSAQRDINLSNAAECAAHISQILQDTGMGPEEMIKEMDDLKESMNEIDVISVVGPDSKRLYHSNHELIDTVYDGTMPDFESNGNCYVVDEEGPSGPQRRAYAVIKGADGEESGFVMTVMLMSNIRERNLKVLFIFLGMIILAIAAEFLITTGISKKVRGSLMGFEPDVFSAMYKIRDGILESLNEGVIAVNADSEVLFVNKAASKMISGGKEGDEQLSSGEKLISGILGKGEKESSIPVNLHNDVDIIMDRHPLTEDGRTVGAVGIMHDRTEYTRLAEDLAGTRFLVDSMRANNHDFTNKLHVIMGLIQMEMYDEALNYIQNITMVQRETISEIMKRVNCPALAALLIGKNARASELNIKFIFDKDSSLDAEDVRIPDDVLVTLTGNLIDNAFDAMNGKGSSFPMDSRNKELKVGIFSGDGSLRIKVEDNGPGIKKDNLEHIFENGFSTKGDGRGIGLYQVKSIAEAYGGHIDVRSQEGTGTSFTLEFDGGKNKNV
ncbi:MAG: Spo0B domain-containing protein [Firmicutes bacterium]|nr:Spo0B domain-containing protein [Bacillota bacterium]